MLPNPITYGVICELIPNFQRLRQVIFCTFNCIQRLADQSLCCGIVSLLNGCSEVCKVDHFACANSTNIFPSGSQNFLPLNPTRYPTKRKLTAWWLTFLRFSADICTKAHNTNTHRLLTCVLIFRNISCCVHVDGAIM